MRIAVLVCALAAGGLPAPVRADPRPTLVAGDDHLDEQVAPRIAVEVILGGAGAIGGAGAGFALAHAQSLEGADVWMMAGIAAGSWLGTSLGGLALGGGSHWMPALIGALCGSAASLALTRAMLSSTGSIGVAMVTMVGLPLLGSVIGYETGQVLSVPPPLKRVGVVVGLAGDGRTLLPGIAGAF